MASLSARMSSVPFAVAAKAAMVAAASLIYDKGAALPAADELAPQVAVLAVDAVRDLFVQPQLHGRVRIVAAQRGGEAVAAAGAADEHDQLRARVQAALHGADDVGLHVHHGREAGDHHFRRQLHKALEHPGRVEVEHGAVFYLVARGDDERPCYHCLLHLSRAQ